MKLDEDLIVKREFQGDNKRYEACANDAGTVLVAIDTTADEELFSELRARSVVAAVQKLRKSAGLQVSDRVEMYYEVVGCKDAKETKAMEEALAQSLTRHIVKRLRQVPRPAASFLTATEAVYRAEVARETLKEVDIVAKGSFVLILTKPALGVSRAAVQSLVEATVSAEAAAGGVDHWVKALTAYLHSVDYTRLVSAPQVSVHLDEQTFVLVRDVLLGIACVVRVDASRWTPDPCNSP